MALTQLTLKLLSPMQYVSFALILISQQLMITGKLHMGCAMSAGNCLQRFSHSCLTIKSHLRLFLNWIDIECGHF